MGCWGFQGNTSRPRSAGAHRKRTVTAHGTSEMTPTPHPQTQQPDLHYKARGVVRSTRWALSPPDTAPWTQGPSSGLSLRSRSSGAPGEDLGPAFCLRPALRAQLSTLSPPHPIPSCCTSRFTSVTPEAQGFQSRAPPPDSSPSGSTAWPKSPRVPPAIPSVLF